MPQPVPIAGYNSITTLTDPLIVRGGDDRGGMCCVLRVWLCVCVCVCVYARVCMRVCVLCGFA